MRADLLDAFQQRSSLNLAIALKLPPLWWEDKLQSIFAELVEKDRAVTVELLLPPESAGQTLSPGQNPLKSDAWQVRANAANMLSFLQCKEAAPRIIESLAEASEGELKAAFCHVSYALGKLGTQEARAALASYLKHEEPWFRVDAARALSCFTLDQVATVLSSAALSPSNLSDYVAVAIARKHLPIYFMRRPENLCRQAAYEMIIEIVRASSQTFRSEVVFESGLQLCWPELIEAARTQPSPRLVRATLSLATFFLTVRDELAERLAQSETEGLAGAGQAAEQLIAQAEQATSELQNARISDLLLANLKDFKPGVVDETDDTRHTVHLLGEFKLTQSAPLLISLLKEGLPFTDDIIEALGALGDPQAAEQLVTLARQSLDIETRTDRPPVAQPVQEEDAEAARHYWAILKALGHLPHPLGLELLVEACHDFAPDKRQQALQSLTSSYKQITPANFKEPVLQAIAQGLQDSSTAVRLAALDGVAELMASDMLPQVIKLIDSKEVSLSRKSLSVISELADKGYKQEVITALETKLKSELDRHKKERLQQFLDSLS